jgi:formamidopyrimidine-DNA glycosylase
VPELIEVECYRRALDPVVGGRITAVRAPDPWYCKRGCDAGLLAEVLVGEEVTGSRRRGKLLLVDTTGPVLGLRFGMTGLVEVGGVRPIGSLQYSSVRRDPAWVRFALTVATPDPLEVEVVDPRRLGGVELDPDEDALGPDAASVGVAELRRALAASRAPLKAVLLDQARVAGIGNLLADEILWRAGLDPRRPARSLDAGEARTLARTIRATVATLTRRGGSHTGDLGPERAPGGRCPRDGTALERATVGGRTTWWCPVHQR